MLNMAPDKAADETTSFQCYPPACLIIYRPSSAHRTAAPPSPRVPLSPLFSFYLPAAAHHPPPPPGPRAFYPFSGRSISTVLFRLGTSLRLWTRASFSFRSPLETF